MFSRMAVWLESWLALIGVAWIRVVLRTGDQKTGAVCYLDWISRAPSQRQNRQSVAQFQSHDFYG